MNKLLLGLIILLVGAAAGWYVFKPNLKSIYSNQPSAPAAQTGESAQGQGTTNTAGATITFTDNGFTPKSLTVKAGTTVRFINESSGQMYVASNPHPTHTLLAGFDELGSVAKGGTYEYQFTKVGTWGYHNHLTPAIQGSVVVTE